MTMRDLAREADLLMLRKTGTKGAVLDEMRQYANDRGQWYR